MTELVKSEVDGKWYYSETKWKYVLDNLCDALGCFSEADSVSEIYIIIDHIADTVSEMIKKNGK